MFLACSYVFPSIKSRLYFTRDLANGVGVKAYPTRFSGLNAPRQAFIPDGVIGWRPYENQQDSWIAMQIGRTRRLAIASVIYPGKVGSKAAWVTTYKLQYSATINFVGNWSYWKNVDTNSYNFNGIQNANQLSQIASVEPRSVLNIKLFPQAFHEAIALRWTMIFCFRKL